MTGVDATPLVPDPTQPRPLPGGSRAAEFIAPTLTTPWVSAGPFTYADMSGDDGDFETSRVLYSYGPERLLIGSFTQIGPGVRFLMPGGLHIASGPSTFPFTIFPGTWQDTTLETYLAHRPAKGDTVVGSDVWLGMDALIMPGVHIGDGAVVAAGSVVTRDVAPYQVVGGNPARVLRQRCEPDAVRRLRRAAWWKWPVEQVTDHAPALMAGSVGDIAAIADQLRADGWCPTVRVELSVDSPRPSAPPGQWRTPIRVTGADELLSVVLTGLPSLIPAGTVTCDAMLHLPGADYTSLTCGTRFAVLVGTRPAAHGLVLY